MTALIYLTKKKIKNRIRQLTKSPSEIFTIIIFILLIAPSLSQSSAAEEYRDSSELFAIAFAVYSLIFVLISKKGFSNGGSMFSMADVNLIFTSPINENKALFYGLLQQLSRFFSFGLVILFQSHNIRALYGMGFAATAALFIGYSLTALLAQMLSMLIYRYTCFDEKAKNAVKLIYYTAIGIFVLYYIFNVMRDGFSVNTLVNVSEHSFLKLFPASAPVVYGIRGFLLKEVKALMIAVIYFAVYCFAFILILTKSKSNYYEDVLKATELSFSAIASQKEGKAEEKTPTNIRIGKIGLSSALGAGAIYAKHKTENRRSRVFFLSFTTIIIAALSLFFSFLSRENIILPFLMNIYTLTFSTAESRWSRELRYPYIYLIPEKSIKKLFMMVKSDLPSLLVESLLTALATRAFIYCSVVDIAAMTLSRFSFGLMFIGINFLLQRIFSDSQKKFISATAYMLFIVIFTAPSIALGIFTYITFPYLYAISFAAMTLPTLIITALLFYFSKGILEKIQ